MTKYLLIRHGETGVVEREQLPGHPLNQNGINQVDRLATHIRDCWQQEVTSIYTSPFLRAKQTAQFIADRCQWKPFEDERLKEIPLWLNPEDLHDDTSEEYVSGLNILADAEKQAHWFLHDLHIKHPQSTLILVCHGNIIRAILGFVLKMDLETVVRLKVSNASITVLEREEEVKEPFYRLATFNDTCHLSGLPLRDSKR